MGKRYIDIANKTDGVLGSVCDASYAPALTAIQKVGYEGPLMFEIAAHGSARETLVRAQKARQRMERLLAD